MPLTRDRLLELLTYDPVTGLFRWKVAMNNSIAIGDVAGWTHHSGYMVIGIDGEEHAAHRLAFLFQEGRWPVGTVDHHDLDPSNNRWKNLREASHARNCANRRLRRDSSTGFKGVYRRGCRFRAKIKVDGQQINLGTFDTAEEAHAAYVEAAKAHFGAFARAA